MNFYSLQHSLHLQALMHYSPISPHHEGPNLHNHPQIHGHTNVFRPKMVYSYNCFYILHKDKECTMLYQQLSGYRNLNETINPIYEFFTYKAKTILS